MDELRYGVKRLKKKNRGSKLNLKKRGEDLLRFEQRMTTSSQEVLAREIIVNSRKIRKYREMIKKIDKQIREKSVILGELAYQELRLITDKRKYEKPGGGFVIESYQQLLN